MLKEIVRSFRRATVHPAVLLSAGNVALIFSHAEPIAIVLNIGLTIAIFSTRFVELLKSRSFGIPFFVLASVNFFTAFSIEFNQALGGVGSQYFADSLRTLDVHLLGESFSSLDVRNLFSLDRTVLAAHASAFALVIWGIGSLFASQHEKRDTKAQQFKENPQTYYGAGDMIAVNASGILNPFSFPFMVAGFIKSVLIGRPQKGAMSRHGRFILRELTAARIYGVGYIVGGLTSLAFLDFAVAQLLWAAAYFSFKKDT